MSRTLGMAAAILILSAAPLWAQTTRPDEPVSREEFEQLKQENVEIKAELATVKKQQADQQTNAEQDASDMEAAMKSIRDDIDKYRPGVEGMVIAGDAQVGYTVQRGTDSTFSAVISPLILWQLPDPRFLVESGFDIDLNPDGTSSIALNIADLSFIVNDYLMIGGGLFVVPFGQFHNHFDPPWINKFPDEPLVFGDNGLAPGSEVGIYAKGAIPSGTTRWTYDVYVVNGPQLITDDPNAVGSLNFGDNIDTNNNKAVGGRIGFLPCPDMEMGYSAQFSRVNPDGFQNVYAVLQAGDFHWKPTVRELYGQFDFKSEYVWSDVSAATYDPTGGMGFGPINFANYRYGGYIEACYRPTLADNQILNKIELTSRADTLQVPLYIPGGARESRYTFGVDYWVTPYIAIQSAFELDHNNVSPGGANAFLLAVGYGL